MNLKPVTGGDPRFDPMKVLKQLKAQLHKQIKAKIEGTAFSQRAKLAFSKAMIIKVNHSSLLLMTKHPGFLPMIRGQKSEQMRWLVKAKAPIPIITDEGKLIFRSATPRSMANGSWVHPGRQPTNFIDQAKREARNYIRQNLSAVILKQIRSALQGK
jgi:hypothetical protein